MNRMYLKPITTLCMILFLVAALAPKSFAADTITKGSYSNFFIKHSVSPLSNSCQNPIEEKEEEKNLDSITNFPILISYLLGTLNNVGPDKLLVCEFGHQALTGNTPLYLTKRTLLI